MRRLRLSTLLVAINVGLLLLAVTGMASVAVRLLRQLADEQALARVGQAGASARNAVSRSAEGALTAAQLLAERPTLQRLLEEADLPALTAFLAQFQQTSRLDGCAVLLDGAIFAASGPPLPWENLWQAGRAQAVSFIQRQPGSERLVMGAQTAIPSVTGATVMVAVSLEESFSRQIGAEIGLRVSIVEREIALAPGPFAGLRAKALESDEPVVARVDDRDLYLATLPLSAPSGEIVGFVETELPATSVSDSLRQLARTLLLLALVFGTLAGLGSFLLGRRFARPLQALTVAAARIGQGELGTPVAAAFGAEAGTLATTLEEMRRRLLQLTADLRRQKAESEAILTGIVEGVFTVDQERRIRYLNPQTAALLGLEAAAVIGRFCGEVLNPQGPDGVPPCEEQCPIVHSRFRTGARATEHLLLHNGERRTVVITSAPPAGGPAPDGDLRQVQVLRDETETEAIRRLRDAVLANISHEFRTPLSAQLASLELLLDQLPELTQDQIGELLLSLQRGALRLTQLIDNLLESVRIEAGQHAIRHQPVALDEVVEAAVEMVRPLLDQRQQELVLDLPYPLPTITGDAPRLTQVFVNLLANAIKFAPPASVIRIGGDVQAQSLGLWVEDQGPGLPPQPTGHSLFAPFVRSPAEEPEQGGAGLGLWIVKSIVERHAGRVEALSTPAGTRISVTLPRMETNEDPGG